MTAVNRAVRGKLAKVGVVALVLGGLAWALYPALIPLLNPSTSSWRSKRLFTEIEVRSAFTFRRVFGDFLIYHLWVLDRSALEGRSGVELARLAQVQVEASLTEARTLIASPDASHDLRASCARTSHAR